MPICLGQCCLLVQWSRPVGQTSDIGGVTILRFSVN